MFSRFSFHKKLKFPTFGDIEPTSFWECRSNAVTLWCRRPQETPFHWQKWMLSFQELMTLRGSLLILALKSSNANQSVSLFLPSTEVKKKPKQQRRMNVCMEKDDDGGAEIRCEQGPMQCGWKGFCLTKMLVYQILKWMCMYGCFAAEKEANL